MSEGETQRPAPAEPEKSKPERQKMNIKIIESSITEPKGPSSENWESILHAACEMMDMGLEPRSALKQCANDAGIPYGDKMQEFVKWAESQWK